MENQAAILYAALLGAFCCFSWAVGYLTGQQDTMKIAQNMTKPIIELPF